MRVDHRKELIILAETYARATGRSLKRISTIVQNDGKFFDGLKAGRGFTMRTYDKCRLWFARNWPLSTAWPPDVPRPAGPAATSTAQAQTTPADADQERTALRVIMRARGLKARNWARSARIPAAGLQAYLDGRSRKLSARSIARLAKVARLPEAVVAGIDPLPPEIVRLGGVDPVDELLKRPVVVDATVAMRWILPDHNDHASRRIRPAVLYAPDLLYADLAIALAGRVKGKLLTAARARALLEQFMLRPVSLTGCDQLAASAQSLAIDLGCGGTASFYLALTLKIGGRLVSDDTVFLRAVGRHQYLREFVIPLRNLE